MDRYRWTKRRFAGIAPASWFKPPPPLRRRRQLNVLAASASSEARFYEYAVTGARPALTESDVRRQLDPGYPAGAGVPRTSLPLFLLGAGPPARMETDAFTWP